MKMAIARSTRVPRTTVVTLNTALGYAIVAGWGGYEVAIR